MVGVHLMDSGWDVAAPGRDGHPDFRCEQDGSVVWVEATCATPGTDPMLASDADWISKGAYVPLDRILLRWTSAVDAKAKAGLRFRLNGVVGCDEGYVIAVNGALVGTANYGFGVSRLPYSVEATMGVGALQFSFDRETLDFTGSAHMARVSVSSMNRGSPISTMKFLNGEDTSTSAVAGFGLARTEAALLGLLVAHNPHAAVPLEAGLLGSTSREWTARWAGCHAGCQLWDIVEIALRNSVSN